MADPYWEGTPDEVTAGDDIVIQVHDPANADQDVTVRITDGVNDPVEVIITLDANGDGTYTYVSDATAVSVEISAPGQASHVVVLNPGV